MPTAIVTGAAGGIGRAVAERLSRNGWTVLAVDRDADKLGWTEGVENVLGHVADVTSEADNIAAVAAAEARFGLGIHAALFNAAIDRTGPIDELPIDDFRAVIDVNLFGPVLGIRAVLPALRRAGGGAILLTSSTMGVAGEAGSWPYSASKHALAGLVYSLSRELGCEGIRVNAVAPGLTRGTGMTSMIEEHAPEVFAGLAKMASLQRWAEPDEMAAVMEFLVSPGASYVTGIVMVADGGAITGTGLQPPKSRPAPASES